MALFLYFWIHELSLAFGLILASFDKFVNFHAILFKLDYISNLIGVQMLCDDQNLGHFSLQDNIKDKAFHPELRSIVCENNGMQMYNVQNNNITIGGTTIDYCFERFGFF